MILVGALIVALLVLLPSALFAWLFMLCAGTFGAHFGFLQCWLATFLVFWLAGAFRTTIRIEE